MSPKYILLFITLMLFNVNYNDSSALTDIWPSEYLNPWNHPWIKHFHFPMMQHSNIEYWSTTVELPGFRPEEITTKLEESDGKQRISIHARHDGESDFTEFRKVVTVPDDVDHKRIHLNFTRRGNLIIQGPFKQHEEEEDLVKELLDDFTRPVLARLGKTSITRNDKGSEIFRAQFDLKGFKPEEIEVHRYGNALVIEAKQNEDTKESSSFRHLRREVTLPDGAKTDLMSSRLNKEGNLIIEAPFERPPKTKLEGQKIPIEVVSVTDESEKSKKEL